MGAGLGMRELRSVAGQLAAAAESVAAVWLEGAVYRVWTMASCVVSNASRSNSLSPIALRRSSPTSRQPAAIACASVRVETPERVPRMSRRRANPIRSDFPAPLRNEIRRIRGAILGQSYRVSARQARRVISGVLRPFRDEVEVWPTQHVCGNSEPVSAR